MKKLVLITLCCSALLTLNTYAKPADESLDRIVAVVNDDVITQTELLHAQSLAKMQLMQQRMSVPADDVLRKQVLDQLINKKVQLQTAKQVGINVTPADLDKAIQSIAQRNQMTVPMLYARLKQEGMNTDDYREEMRNMMTVQKLQQQELISHITISPDEITAFLNSKAWQANGSNEYHLEDILIPTSDTPSSEEITKARARAETLVSKIRGGMDFHAAAQAESGDKHALNGGDLGWRKLAEIPSAFAEPVVQMKKNAISEPIQTPNGFHILHLVASRASATQQSTPSRKEIEQLLMQRKFEEAAQNWISRLRSQAYVVTNPANPKNPNTLS